MQHLYALYPSQGKWAEGYIEYPEVAVSSSQNTEIIFAIPAAPFHDRGNRLTVTAKGQAKTQLTVSTNIWGAYGIRYLDTDYVNNLYREIKKHFSSIADAE